MNQLRVLLVEDSEDDALLLARYLRQSGKKIFLKRVETEDDFRRMLEEYSWDVIISDHGLPRFNSRAALKILSESQKDIPFLIVSGTIGESEAVAAMKAGAHDYLMKGNLARLVPAIEREIAEANHRKARRAADQALRESEAYLRAVTEHIADGLLTLDEPGHILSLNLTAERLFGEARETITGQPVRRFLPELRALSEPGPYECSVQRKDGTLLSVEVAVSMMLRGDQRHFIVTLRDITERKSMERQLQQAQRLEGIARLAGGIAHDFNNILAVILNAASLVQESLPPHAPCEDDIREIIQQSQRASRLVKQLMAFSSRNNSERKELDVSEIIGGLGSFLRRVIGEHIDLQIKIDGPLSLIYADPTQIEQVLMNLCINARDAMPQGGQLTIEACNVRFTEEKRLFHARALPGEYVRLSIQDTGTGIPPHILPNIFDPFFTTKEPGRGTGLGLSVVYGIVKQHDGMIDICSQPGRGTTIDVYLPAALQRPSQPPASSLPREEALRGGQETVLVVEDENAVRRLVRRALEKMGYITLEAADGETALQTFEEHQNQIDIVILDMMLPGRNGWDLYQLMRAQKNTLKALFLSGYTAQDLNLPQISETRFKFLSKPFSPDELLRQIRLVLDDS